MQDRVQFKGTTITRQQVLHAMAQYDAQYPHNEYREGLALRPWLENETYKYAVVNAGRLFPPKYLAHVLTGRDLQGEGLHGGHVNRIFRELRFEIRRIRP